MDPCQFHRARSGAYTCRERVVGTFHMVDLDHILPPKTRRLCSAHRAWYLRMRYQVTAVENPGSGTHREDEMDKTERLETIRQVATRNQEGRTVSNTDINIATTTMALNDLVMEGADFKNPRLHIDKRDQKELEDSIAQHGLIHALAVWQTKVGKKTLNIVVDGGRRFRSLNNLAKSKRINGLAKAVPVRLIEAKTLAEARIKALTANLQRVELSSFEVATEMAALKESGMAQKDIAKQLNKSATWVSRQLSALNKASPTVVNAWKTGKLPDDDVQSLAKLPAAEQEKRVETILEHRSNASEAKAPRAERAKARAAAKAGKDDGPIRVRPGADKIESIVNATAGAGAKDPYVRGMHDMARFCLGELGAGEFGPEWIEFTKNNGFASDRKPAKGATKKASKKAAAK